MIGRLEDAGAEVREASPLSLEESALALLGDTERPAVSPRSEESSGVARR